MPGSKLMFEEQADGSFVVRKKQGDIRGVKGLLKSKAGKRALALEEMDEAIAGPAVGRLDRGR